MRWYKSNKAIPDLGSRRRKRFFAILPVKIKDEVRWLETVTIEEIYYANKGWMKSSFVNV